MKKKRVNLVGIVFILLLFLFTGFLYSKIYKQFSNEKVEKINTIDDIKEYEYILNSNATKYYKELFKELKSILNEENLNEEEYAKKISQLFVCDLFTLSNKITSSDVGGIQYVYKDFQEDFISIAQTGLYSSVKNNIYGNRKQELPEVSEITILNTEKKDFKFKDTVFKDSYYITVEIKYKKDLGYPSEYQTVVSKNQDKLEIVKSQKIK